MSVDYEEIERAVEVARQAFPHAHAIKPLWTPSSSRSNVHVEVWAERRAKVVPIVPGRAITHEEAVALMPAAAG